MPDFRWRVAIPSWQGTFERILNSQAFADQFASEANRCNAMLLTTSWCALLSDSPVDAVKPNRLISRFISACETDLLGLIRRCSTLYDELVTSLVNHRSEIVISNDLHASFIATPVFREYSHFVRTGDPQTLKFLSTFLLFGKKMYFEDEQLDTIAFRKWVEVEDRIRGVKLPAYTHSFKAIAAEILRDWTADFFLPKHGGGAVADRGVKGLVEKNEAFYSTTSLEYLLRDNIFLINETASTYAPRNRYEVIPSKSAASKLKFVPKDLNSTRSICMEPIPNQWAQQAVRLWFEDALLSGPIADNIPLKHQIENAYAAQYGSLTGRVDTIDLSMASDSNSWELTKRSFPARVLKYLAATRTSRVVTPSGETVSIEKFAPMGSALCFPVQSTVYAIVVIFVGIQWRFGIWDVQDYQELDLMNTSIEELMKSSFADTLGQGSDRLLEPFRIYGDDIICDSRITSNVVRVLESLGFTVNTGKSFTGDSAFRESCGGYYYRGHDVTPLRYKVKKLSERIDVESLASVIDLANRAREYGYENLRAHLVRFCLRYPISGIKATEVNPILFVGDDSDEGFALRSSNPHNRHLLTRVFDPSDTSQRGSHVDYQRDEVRSITIGPSKLRKLQSRDPSHNWGGSRDGNYLYYAWWRSRYHEDEESGEYLDSSVAADTLRVGVRWRWTPSA